jgi:hypothetical protein
MKPQVQPWHLLLLILAGWVRCRQKDAIEFLMTENRVPREKLGKKRIVLNDGQRRRHLHSDVQSALPADITGGRSRPHSMSPVDYSIFGSHTELRR